MQGDKRVFILDPSACSDLIWPAPILEDAVFFPVCISGIFLNQKQMSINVWASVSAFAFISLITVSVVFNYYNFVVLSEIGSNE